MGILDYDEERIKNLYHRAWLESGRGFVDTRKYDYLDKALYMFVRENGCTYDEALILAKTGEEPGILVDDKREKEKIYGRH